MNSTELINKAEKRYKELKHKQFDRNSFLNGYFEGYAGSVIQQQVSVEPEVKPACEFTPVVAHVVIKGEMAEKDLEELCYRWRDEMYIDYEQSFLSYKAKQ